MVDGLRIDASTRPDAAQRDPFCALVYRDFFDAKFYHTAIDAWASLPEFSPMPQVGHKFVYNDRAPNFATVLRNGNDALRRLVAFVHDPALIALAREILPVERPINHARLEFSKLPAAGGHILPHPDTAKKVVTIIVYMPLSDWQPDWGGEFETYRHKTRPMDNFTNTRPAFDDVETLLSVPYRHNVASMFARRPNSLHGVRPMKGPDNLSRTSITIQMLEGR